MKLVFVLPRISPVPIGGYKIVYEYANRLANDNIEVTVFYDNTHVMEKYCMPEFIKRKIISQRTKIGPKWFKLDPKINLISSRDKNLDNFFNGTDIAIATGAGTVDIVKKYFKKAKCFYFVQDFEADETGQSWNLTKEQLYKTYDNDFKKITVSKWLRDIIDDHSPTPAAYVRNPLNIEKYKVLEPISDRNTSKIGMLYHDRPRKGCKYTLEAIKRVKKDFPNIELIMFGACPPPDDMPSWITYYQNATQEKTIDIYNSISIFASGAIKEGFGLTSLEAMACGAALVTSDNLGAREYVVNGENSLVSPVKDVESMVKNIENLLIDDVKRQKIAQNGVETAQEYSWDKAYRDFKGIILDSFVNSMV